MSTKGETRQESFVKIKSKPSRKEVKQRNDKSDQKRVSSSQRRGKASK